jgi:hypothetical protein
MDSTASVHRMIAATARETREPFRIRKFALTVGEAVTDLGTACPTLGRSANSARSANAAWVRRGGKIYRYEPADSGSRTTQPKLWRV